MFRKIKQKNTKYFESVKLIVLKIIVLTQCGEEAIKLQRKRKLNSIKNELERALFSVILLCKRSVCNEITDGSVRS